MPDIILDGYIIAAERLYHSLFAYILLLLITTYRILGIMRPECFEYMY